MDSIRKRKALRDHNDDAVRYERALLACCLERPEITPHAGISPADFLLSAHQQIFAAMRRLKSFSLPELCEQDDIDPSYISTLVTTEGHLVQQFQVYSRKIRQAAQERRFRTLHERLGNAINGSRLAMLDEMRRLVSDTKGTDSDSGLIVIRGDEVTEKVLRWMWKPYIPLGKLVHFGGNSSQAKSPVTIDLAARISTGAHSPRWHGKHTGTAEHHSPEQ